MASGDMERRRVSASTVRLQGKRTFLQAKNWGPGPKAPENFCRFPQAFHPIFLDFSVELSLKEALENLERRPS